MLTERQEAILRNIVEDYINLAQPISSEFFEKKHKFGLSPATLRIEFQKLTKKGYLFQPHTSAGRVPTDKAYRFFVNKLLESEIEEFKIEDWIEKEIEDTIKFLQNLTKNLAEISDSLVLSYLIDDEICWKEGWDEVLREPEFFERETVFKFTEFLEDFERNLADLKINSKIKVYIGRENPFPKGKDFSAIVSKCYFPREKETILSILGPKRMDYNKNIALMNSLKNFLENLCQRN
jgi:heat-inducible transcriptional repressor